MLNLHQKLTRVNMKIESPPKTEKHDFNLYLESLQNPDKNLSLKRLINVIFTGAN